MQGTIQQPEERELVGLQDGGHHYLTCNNCRAYLVDVWVTNPSLLDPITKTSIVTIVQAANCPFCEQGGSYPVEIHGGFHPGGYSPLKEGEDEDTIPSTFIELPEVAEDGVVRFVVKKQYPDSKAFYVK